MALLRTSCIKVSFLKIILTVGESADVSQGEPQSMAMIYQLVTQACEQLMHSEYSVSKHVKLTGTST